MSKKLLILAIALSFVAGYTNFATAEKKTNFTRIVVTDMHCETCAKKIAAKLYLVPGVKEVRAHVKKDTAYVVPQQQKLPSAKALWEAVESAGFKLVSLTGPTGQFKTKPKQ